MERCSPTDASPDIARRKEKRYHRKDRKTVSGITMKNLLLNAESIATVYPITTRPKEAMLNGLSTCNNGREESPAQP